MKLTILMTMIALNSGLVFSAEEKPVVTPVPAEFNGNVGSGQRKTDGTVDFMEGFAKDVRGGEFDRGYNGLSGKVETGKPMEDADLNALNVSFLANLYGIAEIGPKFCRPMGTDYPDSVIHWYFPVKDYIAAEKVRDVLLQERMTAISNKVKALTGQSNKDQLQLEAIKLQIETQNALIDSISGSSLYSMDAKASEVRTTSRIAWRERLLTALVTAQTKTQEEDLNLVKVAQACSAGADISASVSTSACERKKKVETCDKDNNCTTTEVPDPVPGSCEVAQTHLPKIRGDIFNDIVKLYSLNQIPSAEISKRYYRLNAQLNIAVNNMPASGDPEYDWTSPIKTCLDPSFGQYLLRYAMACTANHKQEDLAKIDYTGIAPAKADAAPGVEPVVDLASSEVLSDNVQAFLKALGFTDADLPAVSEYFHASWAKDDLMLGHSRQRIGYFDMVKPKIESILSDDKKRLSVALLQRERLLQYYNEVKRLYEGKTGSTNKVGLASTSKKQLEAELNAISDKGLTNTALEEQKKAAQLNSAAGTSMISLSTASNQRLDIVDAVSFNGKLSAATGTNLSEGSNLSAYAVSTNEKLKSSARTLGKLAETKRSVISNSPFSGVVETKASAKGAGVAAAATKSVVSAPTLSSSAAAQFESASIADAVAAMPAYKDEQKFNQLSLSAGGYNGYLQNFGMSGGSFSKMKLASLGPQKAVYSSVAKNPTSFATQRKDDMKGFATTATPIAASGDVNTKLKDAVWHLENSNIKKDYEANESDSLFEALTKAHIRNYKGLIDP